MKLTFIFSLFISLTFGQNKPTIYYNENGKKISKENFIQTKDYSNNLDLYFENDSTQIGLLITRQKFGQLDEKTFKDLKSYLTELTNRPIDSTQNIVINYLSAYPKKDESSNSKSAWDVLNKDYLRKLHKIANISQFWIHSSACDNLEYNHQKRINWIADKNDLLKQLFFQYEIRNGNYILIKPDGKFYYYLGEHSKNQIWEDAEKYFN